MLMMNKTKYIVIRNQKDLPSIPRKINNLYMDVETVSGSPRRGALLPYAGDRVCGVAFTFDDCQKIWYLPIRHKPIDELFDEKIANMPLDIARSFLQELLDRSDSWVNHNVKFDAHFLHVDGIQITSKLIDTLTLAKLVDMQSKQYGYGLKPLAKEWCGSETDKADIVKSELVRRKTKDYGDVPASILGKYACQDVHINRELWAEIKRRRYKDIDRVWKIEVELTNTLFNIEKRGLVVDTEALALARESALTTIANVETEIHELGLGEVNPSSSSELSDFVIKKLELPVIGTTKGGRASVNSEALHGYMELPEVQNNTKLSRFFRLIDKHRDRSQFVALYAEGWLDYINDKEIMHPMYKQTVATGRMACAMPNMQQLNPEAKRFVVPLAGNSFLSFDYSQIEYRVIASLTRDERIFDVYQENPETDFHQYIAELCGIERKPAKTVNFGIAFGMGERALTRSLVASLGRAEAEQEASAILHTYHQKFPRIKQIANLAMRKAASRGWIKTLYGRRRHLDKSFTHKAFNTAVQGTAADIAKERLTAIDNDEMLQNAGVTVRAVVHDEFLLEGRTSAIECPEIQEQVRKIMTSPTIDLGVPLLVSGGHSPVAWSEV